MYKKEPNLLRRFSFLGNIFYSENIPMDFILKRKIVSEFILHIFNLNDGRAIKNFYLEFLNTIGDEYYINYPGVFYESFEYENKFYLNIRLEEVRQLFLNFLIDSIILPDKIVCYLDVLFSNSNSILEDVDDYMFPFMIQPNNLNNKKQIVKYIENIGESRFFIDFDNDYVFLRDDKQMLFSDAVDLISRKLNGIMSNFVEKYSIFF